MDRSTPGSPSFTVKIIFTEPTYAEAQGAVEKVYDWSYEVFAKSAGEAERTAMAEFRRVEQLSSVGWVRQVRRVEVTSRDPRPA